MKSLYCYPNWIQSVDNIKNSLSMLHWISFARMQHNSRKSLSSYNLQYPHQEYSYLLSIFYHISTYQISLHISVLFVVVWCLVNYTIFHVYDSVINANYFHTIAVWGMREVPSTSLPNSMTSGLITDPLLLLAPFITEVMKSENNTIEISYRLSVIVLVSKRENWCVVIQRTNNRYARSVVS